MSPGESYGQLDLIWNSQLIGRYKEMAPGESYIWNWQSSEWTLSLFNAVNESSFETVN